MGKTETKLPKTLKKSVSDVISKIKSQAPHLHHISSATSRLLRVCRHSKSLSLSAAEQHLPRRRNNHRHHQESETADSDYVAGGAQNDDAATLEDIDRFLYENFRSLYGDNEEPNCEDEEEESETQASFESSPGLFATPALTPGGLCDSHRFLTSPVSSGSSIEDVRTSDDFGCISSAGKTLSLKIDPTGVAFERADGGVEKGKMTIPSEDCIAVLKASANVYKDFRRSMGEVMEARARHGQRVDWDFMEELLFCYLRLNEKKQYRYVLGAFVDSVVAIRRNSGEGGGGARATEEELLPTENGDNGEEGKEDIDNLI